jgi:hypothetical protein
MLFRALREIGQLANELGFSRHGIVCLRVWKQKMVKRRTGGNFFFS